MTVATEGTVILGKSGIETYTREVIKAMTLEFPHDTHVVIGLQRRKKAVSEILGNEQIEIRNTLVHDLVLGEALKPLAHRIQQLQWNSSLQKIDVVHFMSHFRYFKTATKSVVTVHDLFPFDDALNIDAGMRKDFLRAMNHHINQASIFLTPSEWVKKTLIEYYPDIASQIQVTPLAAGKPFEVVEVDWSVLLSLGIGKGQQPFVFVGRVDQRKNIGRLLQAYSSLPSVYQKKHPMVLCTSGVPKDIQQLRETYAAELSIPTVFMHIGLPTTTIVHALNAAYALVFPSTMEGFGLPVLEAMRCGCPVITSSVTSLPEVGGEAALYVNPYDVNSILEQLLYIVEHPEIQHQMIQKSLEQAAKFSWQNTARETYNEYQKVVG